MEKLKIYNGFGIVPTKNYIAAGYDFYLPLITDESLFDMVVSAFAKSYKKTTDEIIEIMDEINLYLSSIYDNREFTKCDLLNITHLFLGLTPPDDVDWGEEPEEMSLDEAIDEFVTYRLLFDSKGDTLVPGIVVTEGDYLLFNSGIKVNLPKDTAGSGSVRCRPTPDAEQKKSETILRPYRRETGLAKCPHLCQSAVRNAPPSPQNRHLNNVSNRSRAGVRPCYQ